MKKKTLLYSVCCGEFAANSYLAVHTPTGEAFAVDCPVYNTEWRAMLRAAGDVRLRYLLLTHGHFDHICGVKPLKDATDCTVCIHADDAACLADPARSLDAFMGRRRQIPSEADRLLSDDERLPFGDGEITVLHTPGHTPGSVCFLYEGLLFTGDTLFRMGVGRTDLPGGSPWEMRASLEFLSRFPSDCRVLPGHGEETTLGFEKENNPYLRRL